MILSSNYKLIKAFEVGYLNLGIHLAPHTIVSKESLCPHSTKSCREGCLFSTGRGSLTKVQESRIEKTKFFLERQLEFLETVNAEVQYNKRMAALKGLKLAIRLNLTSDIDYQQLFIGDKTLFELNPDVQWYDYTKVYTRESLFSNYHITYSYDMINHTKAMELMEQGKQLAVVFEEVPKTFMGKTVIPGDDDDLTFLKPNTVIGLKYKNVIKKGFVNKTYIKNSTLVVKKNKELNKVTLKYDY